jgi:hypothetical protein
MADLGLSSSDDETETPSSNLNITKSSTTDDGLGLSDSEEEEVEEIGTSTDRIRPFDDKISKVNQFNILSLPRPSVGVSLHTLKIPPQLGVETDRFPQIDSLHSKTASDFIERNSSIQNQILWKHEEALEHKGEVSPPRVSNTRLVKWSDGSFQLYVGNDVYDVTMLPSDHGFVYAKQTNISSIDGEKVQTVLECHGQVESRFGLRAAGVDGQALNKLKSKMKNQHVKSSKVKTVAIPEELERSVRTESKAKARAKKLILSRPRQPTKTTGNYHDEFDESSISQIKSRFLPEGSKSQLDYVNEDGSEDEDEDGGFEDEPEFVHGRKRIRKGLVHDDVDE